MPATVASRQARRYSIAFVAVAIALLGMGITGSASSADPGAATDRPTTASPIKHVIVVIGENQSFDHVYGTYVPPSGDSISNLLFKGIVRPDGSPGPHFAKAQQFTTSGQTNYFISVARRNKTRLHDPAWADPERGAELRRDLQPLRAKEGQARCGDSFFADSGRRGARCIARPPDCRPRRLKPAR